jgi:hypothetical protein
LKRDALEAWIAARLAEGMKVRRCLSCGSWFAQPKAGRVAVMCDRHVCILAYRWQRRHGRMPPDWLWAKWRLAHGDKQRGQPTSSLRFAA